MTAGRGCPLHYRYRPAQLAECPETLDADVLYVIGGLYGNPLALTEIEAMAERERAEGRRVELVFNGDFNWFNADPACFAALNRRVLRHRAVLGNVEWELADPHPGAGCGCAYPDFVDDAVVARSNRIIARLQGIAAEQPGICRQLRRLPRYRCIEIGGQRVIVLHGDPESLAGWGLAWEHLRQPAHQAALHRWLEESGAQVFAATHTCLPALWRAHDRAIINNGSAGMGNFYNDPRGMIGRIGVASRHPQALLSQPIGALQVELLPVTFDIHAWQALFQQWWPTGSDAALSYGERIRQGTALHPKDCLLGTDAVSRPSALR